MKSEGWSKFNFFYAWLSLIINSPSTKYNGSLYIFGTSCTPKIKLSRQHWNFFYCTRELLTKRELTSIPKYFIKSVFQMQLWCPRFHGFLSKKNIRYLPSASGNISYPVFRHESLNSRQKWSKLRLTSLMATCSLLYRFLPNKNVESKSEKSYLSTIRLKAIMPLKRHGIYKTNPQNMVDYTSSYQVGVHRSFHIQSSCRRENSVQPSLPQIQN